MTFFEDPHVSEAFLPGAFQAGWTSESLATAFPDVYAPTQPPTPSSPSTTAPVSPRQRPTSVRRLLLHRHTAAPEDLCNAGDFSTPAPLAPALSRGETRALQVPGPSSSCVPGSSTPSGATAPHPALGALAVASGPSDILGTRNAFISRLHDSRPTRSRTYASLYPLPDPAQGSGRAHPWPGGFRTRWMTYEGS